MAEVDKDSKTQPPTGRRRSQARARGEVAKSKEINTAAVILSGLAVGLWAVPALLAQHRENMGTWIAIAGTLDVTLDTLPLILGRMRDQVIGLARPFVITAVIAGVAAQVLQTGFIFRLDRLVPKVTKLNPLNGLKRIFGTDGLVNLVKSMLKLALVGYIAYQVVMRSEAGIEEIVSLSIPEMLAFVGAGVRDTVMWVGAVLLVLAVLDYAYAYYQNEQKLKMTKQEVKDELRSSEGDIRMKRRFQQFHREFSKNRMLAEVSTADVVLTNPVHLAVAIRYAADLMRAPQVVAKGAGEVAEQIKSIARGAGVPIVERRALARALFRSVKIGQEVPAALYRAVAEILAYIYSIGRAAEASRQGAS